MGIALPGLLSTAKSYGTTTPGPLRHVNAATSKTAFYAPTRVKPTHHYTPLPKSMYSLSISQLILLRGGVVVVRGCDREQPLVAPPLQVGALLVTLHRGLHKAGAASPGDELLDSLVGLGQRRQCDAAFELHPARVRVILEHGAHELDRALLEQRGSHRVVVARQVVERLARPFGHTGALGVGTHGGEDARRPACRLHLLLLHLTPAEVGQRSAALLLHALVRQMALHRTAHELRPARLHEGEARLAVGTRQVGDGRAALDLHRGVGQVRRHRLGHTPDAVALRDDVEGLVTR
eukprot:scaffold27403_cov62-Phaeocystis_antarctica.AAC.5